MKGGTSINKTFREYNLVFKGLGYEDLPWSVFSFLLGVSTGDLSQSFIDTFSVG